MKEKVMIIIKNFLNLFSDWILLIKLGKTRVFCTGTGAHNRSLRYTENISGCGYEHLHLPLSRVLINEPKFNLKHFTKSHLQVNSGF